MTPERKRELERAWYESGYEDLGIGFGRGSGLRRGAMPDRDYVHAHTYRAIGSAARGIFNGCIISAAIWALLALIAGCLLEQPLAWFIAHWRM
jgi:hypothetical protein